MNWQGGGCWNDVADSPMASNEPLPFNGILEFEGTVTSPGNGSVVPEPVSLVLMATGLLGVAVVRRRRPRLS